MCPHGRAHWRHLANTIELVLPSAHPVHNPNGKSIGSALFAQLTAESPYTLKRALPPKLPLLVGELDPRLIHDSLSHTEPKVQTASRSVHLFSHRWPHSVPILYSGGPFAAKLPIPTGIWAPSNTRFLGPIRAHKSNGISIGSSVFAQMTAVSLYFTMGRPFPPQNCPFPWGDLEPHLMRGSLGPPEPSTPMASRSVQPF